MATSSITKNFVVYGAEQAEIFANAIEESFNDKMNGRFTGSKVYAEKVETVDELKELMERRKKIREQQQ